MIGSEKREIHWRFLETDEADTVGLWIYKQTNILSDFTPAGETFRCKNGIVLASRGSLQWAPMEGVLYLRGCEYDADNLVIEIQKKDVRRIVEALTEYNFTFFRE
jgi:hypothetical protein